MTVRDISTFASSESPISPDSTMASLSIQRLSRTLRSSSRQFQAISHRNYAVLPAKPAWVPRTPPKAPAAAAKVSTGTGVGNPATIESLPNTASELKVASEIPPPNVEPPAITGNNGEAPTDWSKSYHGLSEQAFSKDVAEILLAPIDPMDIEMKPGEFYSFSIVVYPCSCIS